MTISLSILASRLEQKMSNAEQDPEHQQSQ